MEDGKFIIEKNKNNLNIDNDVLVNMDKKIFKGTRSFENE